MSLTRRLDDRALIRVDGPDARAFLNRLLTQEVETLGPGELRYGALLTPQGRVLYDLFLWAEGDDAVVLDVSASARDALLMRLNAYKLRAAVSAAADPGEAHALWGADSAPDGWRRDPRHPEAGFRCLGEAPAPVAGAEPADEAAGFAHRAALGLVDVAADGLSDRAYATEANLDLTHGVDFSKGCFVGQETTSRMKRRGGIRSRVLPLRVDGARPGDEVLAGSLRAGEVVAVGAPGLVLALLRLDRIPPHAPALTVAGRPAEVAPPPGWSLDAPPARADAAS